MDYLEKLTKALGIEPNITLSVSILLSTFLIIIALLYISVPFILLRIRKEVIGINNSLRTLYILDTDTNNLGKSVESENENLVYDEKPTKDNSKFRLDDEDIKKLKAIGFDVE